MEQILNTPQVELTNTSEINANVKSTNGLGLAGFITSITGLILCWVPVLCWLLLIPAFLMSFIGQFRKPRTLAIIGAIISGVLIFIKLLFKIGFWGGLLSLALL